MKSVCKLDQFQKINDLIDKSYPEEQQRVQLCKILLDELSKLTPADLSDYLEFYGLDFVVPGIVIRLKFPVQAHVFNPDCADIELGPAGPVSTV